MEIRFVKDISKFGEAVVIVTNSKFLLPDAVKEIEKIAHISLKEIIDTQKYNNKQGKVFIIPTATTKLQKIICINTGDKSLDIDSALKIGGKIQTVLESEKVKTIKIYFASHVKKDEIFNIMLGALIRNYNFDKYITKKKNTTKIESFEVISDNPNQTNIEFEKTRAIYEGVKLTKTLVSEPPNVLNPETFSVICKELSALGVEIEILNEDQMKELGMGSLLGVARGSKSKPKLVTMSWNGGAKDGQPLAFVGKGVTFDTGGLSLKPPASMVGMKYDMAGAAVVTGLMKTLALRKAKVNAIGCIGLVENMPDANAMRPDDIVTSMSGQTIEVLNTDAEGRLVLADVLWYVQDKYKPIFMINLATLTGAILVTFADKYAGLFSNNDALFEKIFKSGEKSGELVWRLPLSKEYDKMINSDIADVQNIQKGRGAGSITAAQFLQRFVNEVPWAHLDIAGVASMEKNTEINRQGATAFGVRLLNQLVADYYENK